MVIAGPNPTVDRLVGIDRLAPGFIHRSDRVEARFGGGGVNAARVAARLGADPTLVTVIPAEDEDRLLDELRDEGITVTGIRRPGRTRMATIVREQGGRTSVLHEPGATLDVAGWEELAKVATAGLAVRRILLCSGSLPPPPMAMPGWRGRPATSVAGVWSTPPAAPSPRRSTPARASWFRTSAPRPSAKGRHPTGLAKSPRIFSAPVPTLQS
jgi:hypothetical protein